MLVNSPSSFYSTSSIVTLDSFLLLELFSGTPPVLVYSGCYHRIVQTGCLRQQTFISLKSGSYKSEVRGPSWLGSGTNPLPDFQIPAFLIHPHMEEREGEGDPPCKTHLNLVISHRLCLWTITLGVKAQHTNFEGYSLVHSTISLGSPLLPFPNYYCYQTYHAISSYFIFDWLGLNFCIITWSKSISKPYHIYLQIMAWI